LLVLDNRVQDGMALTCRALWPGHERVGVFFLRLLVEADSLRASQKSRPIAGESDAACRRNPSANVPVSLLSSCAPNARRGAT
jgi:hypothetical protein